MLRRFLHLLGLGAAKADRSLPVGLPVVPRDELASFLSMHEGLPQVDWSAINTWILRRDPDTNHLPNWRRAVAAAWLDELRDTLADDHRRWQHARVEGLGPLEADRAILVARAADKSYEVIEKALRPLRGANPIPPISIVALSSASNYYSFISHFFPDEGEWGTSGGVFIHRPDAFPLIVLPAHLTRSIENVIAHELAHHACKPLRLPKWIEEGITQMMEERVTGRSNFKLNHEMLDRHRHHWDDEAVTRYLEGESFLSATDDEQELAYHLSQLVVRGLLTREPERFFAFARACAKASPEDAFADVFGRSPREAVEQAIHPGR